MELKDVWKSVEHIRNEGEEIIAVQVPIDMWRFLIDRVQEMEDREAARERLQRLRKSQEAGRVDADQ
ncbi:MAG: hypothetical protein JW966_10900 [Anaerolineae bacterium]|nr:hypothetical protein [Anaerolineae bacterium]